MLPPSGADPQTLTRMSPAALLSRWHAIEGLDVYRPYVAAEVAAGPARRHLLARPREGYDVNWLNIFYAIEWAVFAGFAFYLWYRLARDAWERELEELEDGRAGGILTRRSGPRDCNRTSKQRIPPAVSTSRCSLGVRRGAARGAGRTRG